MKHFCKLMFFSLTLLLSIQASADVVVGTGNDQLQAIPIEPYYGYSYSQSIYLASEIGASGNITGLKWYWSGTSSGLNSDSVTIYMANTTKTAFASGTDWVASTALTQVFKGKIVYPAAPGWVTITFSTPFAYNGVGNLLVAAEEDRDGYDVSTDDFYCSAVSTMRSICYYNDNTNPTIGAPPTANYTGNFIPNATFVGITQACPTPTNPVISSLLATTCNLSWTASGANSLFQYGPTGFVLGSGTSSYMAGNTRNLTGLTASTSYQYYIKSVCGAGDSSAWAGPFSFTTPCVASTLPWIDSVESQLGTTNSTMNNCWYSPEAGTSSITQWNVTTNGTTPSSGTGANVAHSGSKYFYLEASYYYLSTGPATLYSPQINLGSSTGNVLSYWYHMFGVNMGKLIVQISSGGGTWTTIDSIVGQQQILQSDPWLQKTIPISGYSGTVQFRLLGYTTANGFEGDICVDDFKLISVPVCSGTLPAHVATVSDTLACTAEVINMSVSPNLASTTSGITYQWQKSTTSATAGFTNIAGATSYNYSTTQSATTWYKCIVTCTATTNTVTSNVAKVTQDNFANCYCTSAATNTADDDIGQFKIGTFANPAVTPTPQTGNTTSTATYTNYNSLGPITLNSVIPNTVDIYQINSTSTQYSCWAKVYIDLNKDGVYDPTTEEMFSQVSDGTNSYHPMGTITIPTTAMAGVTGMRVVLREFGSQTTTVPCGTYTYGETEDYLVNIVHPPACSGTLPAINSVLNDTDYCVNEPVMMSLGTVIAALNITYQWQSSTTSATAGFTNITGATNPTYTTTQTVNTWYRCVVTCTNSGSSVNSSVSYAPMAPFYGCYCSSMASSTVDDDIGQFIIGGFTNPSLAPTPQYGNATSVGTYTNYTNLPPIQLSRNMSAPVGIYQINSSNTQYDCWAKVFIDYNHDGAFDTATETFFSSLLDSSNSYFALGSGVIPNTAMLGITRLRVVLNETTTASNNTPCGTYFYGETEDYLVDLTCTSNNTLELGADTVVCSSTGLTLNAGTGFSTYNWSTGATTPTIQVTASGNYKVNVTDSSGCSAQDSLMVTLNVPPVLNLGHDTTVCNTSYTINPNGSNNYTYLWNTGATTPSIIANASGTYSATAKNNGLCPVSDTVLVTLVPHVSASSITPSWTGANSFTFLSNASNATSYTWNFGDGSATSSAASPTHNYGTLTGPVTVTLKVSNSCGDTTITMSLVLGIQNHDNNKFKVYPNPTKDYLIIELTDASEINEMDLISTMGQVIKVNVNAMSSNMYKLSLPELASGSYILRIHTKDGVYNESVMIK